MIGKISLRIILVIVLLLASTLVWRMFWAHNNADLKPWHTFTTKELNKVELDHSDWDDYINSENKIFLDIERNVTSKIKRNGINILNRYDRESPVYPGRFFTDWNRSYIMRPQADVKGAVVLLHGLTDSPYSLRHIAELYQQSGYVAVSIRLPGHGTVPGALTAVKWQDWLAATRLAVREATELSGKNTPLHIVGFSNGGALAIKYTLDALDNEELRMPQQVVLISPMIGITRLARFANFAGWPAIFPAFSQAAWLDITPEFNPFKYNSFPINGARQAHLLTINLRNQIIKMSKQKKWNTLPPILTFQSVIDSTVSTKAVVDILYQNLPDNRSELVLFDINRAINFRSLFRNTADTMLSKILPQNEKNYIATVIRNVTPNTMNMQEVSINANTTTEKIKEINLAYPADVFSLSHIALPFPVTDSLYGSSPEQPEKYGVSFGKFNLRGERSVLLTGFDSFMRISSNPFFPYVKEKINNIIE
ncbi:TPA: alpha/beta hydrolase [Citrobacter amalonaticus]